MMKNFVLLSLALTLASVAHSQKVLFDNVKGEVAGNADWVIDADTHDVYVSGSGVVSNGGTQSDAQRFPTPDQSTVTAATAENYWTGGISAWGIECVKTGYHVESLPYNVAITHGSASNVQDLSNYDVYVVDEPNTQYTAAQKTAILNFVYNGGGLFIVSDHNMSDRNGDGWDSPNIWNDLMTTNTVQANPFGISFDLQDFSGNYGVSNIAGDSILNGPYGNVSQVKWSGGTSMTLNTTANPTVKGVVYKSGGSGNTNVLVAYGYYGKGRFAAMGDSSPSDDGSGDPGDVLYGGWTTDAAGNHRKLIMNMTIWLMGGKVATGISDMPSDTQISLYPNPIDNILNVKCEELCTLEIFDISGQKVFETKVEGNYLKHMDVSTLYSGMYMYKMTGEKTLNTGKLIKR